MKSMKKAFTLIELLVVITIIGILATGATTIFTSQIQKARDTTRIGDLKALQSAVEQVYQDAGIYPYANTFGSGVTGETTGITTYINPIPTDPKFGQPCNGGSTCATIYGVSSDNNSILFGEYELSIAFENEANRTQKAQNDSGDDALRFEVGLDVGDASNHDTSSTITTAITMAAGACNETTGAATATATDDANDSIYINSDC